MTNSRGAILAALVALLMTAACAEKESATRETIGKAKEAAGTALDATRKGVDKAMDATKDGADKALDATKDGADKALDATKDGVGTALDQTQKAGEKASDAAKGAVGKVLDKTKKLAGGMTDARLASRVKERLAAETLLVGSDISVDASDHVVTLKGTVATAAARDRADVLARESENVTRVVNQLLVK